MHTISSYRGNRPTHTQTHRQDLLQYTAPQLASAQCSNRSQSMSWWHSVSRWCWKCC